MCISNVPLLIFSAPVKRSPSLYPNSHSQLHYICIMYKAKVNGDREFDVNLDPSGTSGTLNGNPFEMDCIRTSDGSYHVIKDHKSYVVELLPVEDKKHIIKINGVEYDVELRDKYDELLKSLGMEGLGDTAHKDLKAPMPGLVLEIMVSPGQEIAKGDPIMILEAMKMENVIKSPGEAVVKSINIKTGQAVEKNEVLIDFE
ncbi:MAG: biotin carboxyl carrier protein [Gammaproteobacteria bacterium]